MINALLTDRICEAAPYMDSHVIDYLSQCRTETFESFEGYYLFAFDWYDVFSDNNELSKITAYCDSQNVFFFCEDERTLNMVTGAIPQQTESEVLYRFFLTLLREDIDDLDRLEAEITDAEDLAISETDTKGYLDKIILFRKELLRRKRYYEQLTDIFENLKIDDEKLLSHDAKRHFAILQSRAEKLCSTVMNLRDYVTQMREAYQSQVDIEQNQLMKYFTVITALFLPLTLLVGWYGMNFTNMPELSWKYGYASIIGLSILICTGMILWFKKKKWF